MAIKVDIISGFLGAGKTTLIKKLLDERLSDEKVVLIENEYGEVGIDGALLKGTGLEVREITSGCICCSLTSNFVAAIDELVARYAPDRIVIEPSGVGKLSDVVRACETSAVKNSLTVNMLIAVVDVRNFEMNATYFGEFYRDQIARAKTVILSRTQHAEAEQVETVASAIRRLNRTANVVTTPWEKLSAKQIIAVAEQHASINLSLGEHHHGHGAQEVFDAWSTESPKIVVAARLQEILDGLRNVALYGQVLRGKGVLQESADRWLQFDYVPGECRIVEIGADYSGRVCIIGKELNKQALGRLF